MTFFFLYVAAGALCALLADRVLIQLRAHLGERAVSAILCLSLWPLWAPIALTRKATEPAQAVSAELSEAKDALEDARSVVRATPLEALLTEDVAQSILGELEQLVRRRDELRRLSARTLGSKGTPTAADRDGAARLGALAERDELRIRELIGLVGALRTRLVLARYSGASIEGLGDMLTELTTRVETLDELFSPPVDAKSPPFGERSAPRESIPAPV